MNKIDAQKEIEKLKENVAALQKIIDAPEPKKDVTERIKTFEDACRETNTNLNDVIKYGDTKDEVAYKKLKIIGKALNEGWTPDWDNSHESKYFPYFHKTPGFSFDYSYYFSSGSFGGGPLFFKSKELSDYFATQFLDICKDFY